MSFTRRIKKKSGVYLAEVKNYREDGKVKQKVIRYIGKEVDGQPVKKISSQDVEVVSVKRHLDYKILHEIAEKLSLTGILGKHANRILLLVYTQLITRNSLYKLPEHIEQTTLKELLNLDKIVDKQLYETLDFLEDLDFGEIEDQLFKQLLSEKDDDQALVLDVTDTYFNGSQAEWKSRKGKDGKYDKLVQIALAVTKKEGFPILHKLYEGNIGNTKIFADLLSDIRLKDVKTIILDRGMISKVLLEDLLVLKQAVITGLRMNQTIKHKYLDQIEREEIYQPAYRIELKNTVVFAKEFEYLSGKLIAIYNPELESAKRERAMRKADKYDSEQAKYMGYSLIFHTTEFEVADVIRTYFEKDIVEKAYKELKGTINLHPVRKYLIHRVRAHVKICYLAYAILSYIQYKVGKKGLSAVYALEKLQSAYKVELKSEKDKFEWSKIVTLSNEQEQILKLLECSV